MKKHLWICIVLLALFSVYAVTFTFATQRPVTIQPIAINPPLQTTLTHNETKVFNVDYFDRTNATYANVEGNDTLALSQVMTIIDQHESNIFNDSFTDDVPGQNPANWDVTEDPAGSNISVFEEAYESSQVVGINHFGAKYAELSKSFAAIPNSTITFYLCPNATAHELEFCPYSDYINLFWMFFRFGSPGSIVWTFNGMTEYTLYDNLTLGVWTKVSVFINCTDDTAKCWINNEYVEERPLNTNFNAFSRIMFATISPNYPYSCYLDNITVNVTMIHSTLQYANTGSYALYNISFPTMFVYNITTYCTIPDLTELTAEIYIPYGIYHVWFPVVLNYSINTFFPADTIAFRYNFSSDDGLATPELFGFTVFYNETVANVLPQLGTILVTFDNETLEATIACLITDPDADNCTVTLCLPLGTIVDTQTDIANGTIVEFIVLCNYSTSYQYYLNVTDGEDAVQSSLFGWSTEAEPELPSIHYATIYDYVAVGITFFMGFAFVSILSVKKFK